VLRSDGTMIRDYLYVVDGALAYLRLVEAMADDPAVIGEAFNFSTETPLSVLDLLAALQKAAGTDLEPDIRATATHEIDSQFLSAAKARKVLGWEPTVSVEDALVRTVDWYREHIDDVS
jgi:CDP-glucose 4,6-dehydratase